ncbi:thymidylate synthase [Bacillus phage vB_BanS_Sophrita]|uniref:thymidylate synthase n=1 Tax=Bacillus phage vB_BanS_Sophrita TaxID=2894790 RepID=A0AAE8YTZ7_9CAUD|nr:thymidylate synthase [Bacillus phage vB_BanS_Sophrita]UGO50773.1 thymidylate synthase [Bacillus phage vB_BanS_Sophrita]
MNKADLIYKQNLQRILDEGCWDENPRPRYKSDGAPAHSIFITQVFEEYDISKGEFPITTLRPIAIKNAINEIDWIYKDQTSELKVLEDKYGIHWWGEWGIGDGTIGQRYGATVSKYDLMNKLIEKIKNDPYGRRHIICLWQEQDFKDTEGLPPCAFMTIWSVRKVNGVYYLDCTLIQRSSDYAVAGHINMMQYVALQMQVAHEVGMVAGKFVRFTQNLHVYDRHIEQVKEMLKREPSTEQPKLILNAEGKSFYEITSSDFELTNYNPVKPQLKFELGI